MLLFYLIKCSYSRHRISANNMFTCFCCWRYFQIDCTSICFFKQRFKISINNVWHFIWPHVLINFNILSFSNGITIPQETLFSHTFSWDLNLFPVQKKGGNLNNKNHHYVFKLFFSIMQILFLLKDNARLPSLRLRSLR